MSCYQARQQIHTNTVEVAVGLSSKSPENWLDVPAYRETDTAYG
jgi:hypothetical protein